jgi:hypothetical protein
MAAPVAPTTKRVGLTVKQGDDHPIVIPVLDVTGRPVDCTGWTAKAQARDRLQNLLHTWSTVLGNALCGPEGVELLTDDSISWEWTYGHFDVVATDPGGTQVVPVDGIIQVVRLWTR